MPEILTLLQCLKPLLSGTSVRQLSRIAIAMLAMTGRVTMLGISRWTGKGGSYRTVQRLFHTVLPWTTLLWVFFRQHLWDANQAYLLAGDEVVVTKAGKKTYGLDRFFSSLYGKSVSGLSFFALSLVSIEQRRSYPISIQQVVNSQEQKVQKGADNSLPPLEKRRPGRPKGSKTKNKTEVNLTPELLRIQAMIATLLELLGCLVPLTYLVLDGHFGNHNALEMTRQINLHLISKLRCDSALYLPYHHPDSSLRCRRKYGDKLDYRRLPSSSLKNSTVEGHIQTDIYQIQLLHQEFAHALNVVILLKTNLRTQACTHVILFTSDLELSYDKLIDYYSLRFQIEFNFRDAKQFWGLEDFMTVHPTAVTNAANLSFFMVNLSHHLLGQFHAANPRFGIVDLKAYCRGHKYVDETIKLLPQKPEPVLLAQIFQQISCLGRVHRASPCVNPA